MNNLEEKALMILHESDNQIYVCNKLGISSTDLKKIIKYNPNYIYEKKNILSYNGEIPTESNFLIKQNYLQDSKELYEYVIKSTIL